MKLKIEKDAVPLKPTSYPIRKRPIISHRTVPGNESFGLYKTLRVPLVVWV